MHPPMDEQLGPLSETFPACFAGVRLLIGMNVYMIAEILLGSEPLRALGTDVSSDIEMRAFDMPLEIVL
jgi:hypothetical protein